MGQTINKPRRWCTDPECRANKRGIRHTCGQCSLMLKPEDRCACFPKQPKDKPS